MTSPNGFRTPIAYANGPTKSEQAIQEKLQSSLSELERTGGAFGWIARSILSAGDWIEREIEDRKQTIGGVDNMWLLLSGATSEFNPVCACTYTLRSDLDLEALHRAVRRLEKKFPRYHQRLTDVGRKFHGARFEDDPCFDINNHAHCVRLPEPAGKRELDEFMGDFIAQDWDLSKPLWEMVILENYRDEEGAQCALVSRGHHTLADGQGFVISQLYITSYHDELVSVMNGSAQTINAAKRGYLLPSKVHPLLRPLDPYSDTSRVLIAPLIQLILVSLFWVTYMSTFTISFFLGVYHAAIQLTTFMFTFWRSETLTAPQPGIRVCEREYSNSKVVSLDDIRLCQQAFSGMYPGSAVLKEKEGRSKVGHVTINDVMCAVMVDVLAEEIDSKPQGTSLSRLTKAILDKFLPSPIGFLIPISIRKPGDWSMRNLSTISMVYLNPTPHGVALSPQLLFDHIHKCRSSLSLLKHSVILQLLFHLTHLTGQIPTFWPIPFGLVKSSKNVIREYFVVPLINYSLQAFPVILTNVPGPAKKPITLEGVEVISWTALPPQGGKGTIGMGIISYAGGLCISVAADRVPASEGVARRICERFERRFEVYVQCARDIVRHSD